VSSSESDKGTSTTYKLPPPPPYPGTSSSLDTTAAKLSIPSSTGKVSLINVGISSVNSSSPASVITTSYITDLGNQSTKDIIQGLSSRKLVINNNAATDKRDIVRTLSNVTRDEELVEGLLNPTTSTEGAKSIIINTGDAITMHTNNNKISVGSGISGVKYLLPLSPVQISSTGKLEKTL
jgi:hypothetical protein